MRTLLPALLVLAGCSAGPQGDDESGFTIIRRPPPPAAAISIQSFEPALAVEGRMVVVHFTLSNYSAAAMTGRVRSTISPVASAPVAGGYDWPINGLAAGQSSTGVIAFVAPAPGHANSLDLFFEDGSTHAREYDAATAFDVAGRYVASILQVSPNYIRAHLQDQVHIGFSGWVRDNDYWTMDFDAGPMHSGDVVPGPASPRTVDLVPDVDQLVVGSVGANLGDNIIPVSKVGADSVFLAQGAMEPSAVVADLSVSPAAGSCDGPLFAWRETISGRLLLDAVNGGGHAYFNSRDLPGYPPPSFCGMTSDYWFDFKIERAGDTGAAALAITPPLAAVIPGGSAQFTAAGGRVDWSVEGGAINGYIDATGRYTPPARDLDNQQVIVHALLRGTSAVANAYVTMHPRGVIIAPAPTF